MNWFGFTCPTHPRLAAATCMNVSRQCDESQRCGTESRSTGLPAGHVWRQPLMSECDGSVADSGRDYGETSGSQPSRYCVRRRPWEPLRTPRGSPSSPPRRPRRASTRRRRRGRRAPYGRRARRPRRPPPGRRLRRRSRAPFRRGNGRSPTRAAGAPRPRRRAGIRRTSTRNPSWWFSRWYRPSGSPGWRTLMLKPSCLNGRLPSKPQDDAQRAVVAPAAVARVEHEPAVDVGDEPELRASKRRLGYRRHRARPTARRSARPARSAPRSLPSRPRATPPARRPSAARPARSRARIGCPRT